MNSESYVIRIDGNPDYHYCKATVKVISNNIFVVNHHYGKGYFSYDYLCEELIDDTDSETLRQVYTVIWENQYHTLKAVEQMETDKTLDHIPIKCTRWENNEPVEIKGVTISNW